MPDKVAAPGKPSLSSAENEGASRDYFNGVAYEAIEAAVMETERGRWFLREFARRVRADDLGRIEAALTRIEQRLPLAPNPAREAETRIVALSVHKRLVDLAAALRDRGVDEDACARIEAQANALLDLARRRSVIEATEPPEQAIVKPRAAPAA